MIRFTLDKIMFEHDRIKIPQLQKQSGVNKNTLYSIYNNTSTRIDLSVIDRICRVLNCSPGDLLEFVEEDELSQGKD